MQCLPGVSCPRPWAVAQAGSVLLLFEHEGERGWDVLRMNLRHGGVGTCPLSRNQELAGPLGAGGMVCCRIWAPLAPLATAIDSEPVSL